MRIKKKFSVQSLHKHALLTILGQGRKKSVTLIHLTLIKTGTYHENNQSKIKQICEA